MSAQNAIQLATAIQSKVGSSLISANNLLPRDEAAGTMVQAGASSLGVFLLRDLYDMQQKTYECVEKVASILQSQLDLAEDTERRERDQAAELAKEKRPGAVVPTAGVGGAGMGQLDDSLDDIQESIDKGRFSELLTGGLTAALLAPQAIKSLGKSLGSKLLKGGMYGAIAGFVAQPIIDFVNTEFDLELDEAAQKELKLGMIGGAVGFGVAGIPGAVIGATTPYIARVAKFISGNLDASKVSDKDFAIAGIGTAAAGMFTAGKVGALLAGSKIGAVATFGAALGSLPVLIGIGGAIALGAGAMFITKKIDEYQEMTLEKLANTTEKLSKQMGEWAAKEEESLLEKMGIRLGKLSAIGEASVATDEAQEQLKQKGVEKFTADTAMQTKLLALGDTLIGYSDSALRDIMADRTKSRNFFNTIESLKSIASQGGFGESSKDIFEKMSAFSDRIQNFAKAEVKAGNTGGAIQDIALNKEGFGGDQLEKAKDLQNDLQKAQIRQANAQEALMYAKMARETEDKEQQKTLAGKIADLGFNTDIERAESDAQKELASANAKAAFAQKQLDKLGTTMGLQFDFKDVQKLYKDDPEGLKALIERSINNQGQAFLQEQAKANAVKEQPGANIAVDAKRTDASVNTVKKESNNYQLNSDTDPIALRLGMAT